jgi:hypothetical protein
MARKNWRASKKNPYRSIRDRIVEDDSQTEINDFLSHQDPNTIDTQLIRDVISPRSPQQQTPVHH